LVDDEPTVLKLSKLILEKHGFIITAYDSPTDALNKANPYEYDLLISDLVMPEMNGLEMIQKFRSRRQDIKAIIISASADMAKLQKEAKPNTFFLSKPFQFDKLVELIKSVL
jgi:DNA-binding NtrC family response regulator